jgi:hypothetical protein
MDKSQFKASNSSSQTDMSTNSLSNGLNEIFTEILTNISFYSSMIVAFSILILSFSISNPMKGVAYMGWILVATVVRIIILILMSGGKESSEKCKKGSLPGFLSNYDGGRNSIYILSFTLLYICFPMFITKNINWYLVWLLFVFLIFDIVVKFKTYCVTSPLVYMGEIFCGAAYGLGVSAYMYYLGLTKFLFINDVASNREVCSVAKNQTFKCAVYKNGEIISTITK